MEKSLKTGFAQIFSHCPKNLSCPNFGGAAAPFAPPARTPMLNIHGFVKFQERMVLDFLLFSMFSFTLRTTPKSVLASLTPS